MGETTYSGAGLRTLPSQTGRANGYSTDIDLPVLSDTNLVYTAAGVNAILITGYVQRAIYIGQAGGLRDSDYPNGRTPNAWITTVNAPSGFGSATVAINNNRGGVGAATISIPASAFDTTFTWTRWSYAVTRSGAFNDPARTYTFTLTNTQTISGLAFRYSVTYRPVYTINRTSVVESDVQLDAEDDSQAVWGERPITYPPWFRSGAQAGAQDRINDLAKPRQLIALEAPLWQDTEARSLEGARMEPR